MKLSFRNKVIFLSGLFVVTILTFLFVSGNFNFGIKAFKQNVLNTPNVSTEASKTINSEAKENQPENHFNLIGIINKIIPN